MNERVPVRGNGFTHCCLASPMSDRPMSPADLRNITSAVHLKDQPQTLQSSSCIILPYAGILNIYQFHRIMFKTNRRPCSHPIALFYHMRESLIFHFHRIMFKTNRRPCSHPIALFYHMRESLIFITFIA